MTSINSNAAGSTSASAALFERTDIHRSCKALELVVNSFNDYCQAAESLSAMQKKLAKALKEAAACKGTGEVVVNGLTTAASAFETLAEAESRFVKLADRECEGSSNEVKKWFKKLAKEEKAHDDRIAAANAKIKQAGQSYEKKAKRKDRDAAEEHQRYVNLLSVVGPEMAQEKFNHSTLVSERHTATLSLLAASLSRTAEAEWARVCESIRRMSSIVGKVGECRAFLEGGWTSSIPDVVNSDTITDTTSAQKIDTSTPTPTAESAKPPSYYSPSPSTSSSANTSQLQPPVSPFATQRTANLSQASSPPTSFVKPFAAHHANNADSVRSIESLSSFPTPPTHFPLPSLLQQAASMPSKQMDITLKESSETSSSAPDSNLRAGAELTDSPVPIPNNLSPTIEDTPRTSSADGETVDQSPTHDGANDGPSNATIKQTQARSGTVPLFVDIDNSRESVGVTEKYEEVKGKPAIERSESVTSSSSVVAQLRDKLSQEISNGSPPREREKPRLSYKVSDLVNKYGPSSIDDRPTSPTSPRWAVPMQRQVSPSTERILTSPSFDRRQTGPEASSSSGQRASSAAAEFPSPSLQPRPRMYSQGAHQNGLYESEDLLSARRRHIEELEELELREQAHALRERERQIELQTLELERERLRMLSLGISTRTTSGDRDRAATGVRPHSQHSYSTTNLVSPRAGGGSTADLPPRPLSQYGEPLRVAISHSSGSSNTTGGGGVADHAPYCGCQSCASASYASPGRVSETSFASKAEKPKGWIRRLSMPVVSNAFLPGNGESKKGSNNVNAMSLAGRSGGGGAGLRGYAGGGGGMPSEDGLVPKASFERDATGGISNVISHSRSRKLSFGRR